MMNSSFLFLWPDEPSHRLVAVTTAAATIVVLSILRRWLYPVHPKTIPGPLQTVLPRLGADAVARLDYAPDFFPGARDVPTPYGSMRVYEWGPTTGRKVLFIHGISTSCQTLTKIAHGVAARGHRVMLYDLFGRGFSDGVGDVPHDARLYVSQALCALASSPLSWLGDDGFDLVGYSLGGGVAVHFAASFPKAVRSLVLLAPAGVIRPESFGVVSRLVFTWGLVPERLLAWLTRKRLQRPIASSAVKRRSPTPEPKATLGPAVGVDEKPVKANGKANGNGHAKGNGRANGNGRTNGNGNGYANGNGKGHAAALHLSHHHHQHNDPIELGTSEVACHHGGSYDPAEPGHRLEMRVMRYVRWQLAHHAGFVPAFMGCIREGPLMDQHDAWRRLGEAREPGTTCVLLARDDEIIDAEAYEEDALPLLGGPDRVRWRVVDGSHDFVMTHSEQALAEVDAFWRSMERAGTAV